jgi:excisionase family DNA binding protein
MRRAAKNKKSGALEVKRKSAPAKPTPAPADEIMTVASLANYLQRDPRTLYRLLKERKIAAFKVGSDWRILRSEIDKWMARMPRYQKYKLLACSSRIGLGKEAARNPAAFGASPRTGPRTGGTRRTICLPRSFFRS